MNLPAFEKFTDADSRIGNHEHHQGPVTPEETMEQPWHRQTNVHEQQHDQHFRNIDVALSPAVGQGEWIMPG